MQNTSNNEPDSAGRDTAAENPEPNFAQPSDAQVKLFRQIVSTIPPALLKILAHQIEKNSGTPFDKFVANLDQVIPPTPSLHRPTNVAEVRDAINRMSGFVTATSVIGLESTLMESVKNATDAAEVPLLHMAPNQTGVQKALDEHQIDRMHHNLGAVGEGLNEFEKIESLTGMSTMPASAGNGIMGEMTVKPVPFFDPHVDDFVKLPEPPYPKKGELLHQAIAQEIAAAAKASSTIRAEVTDSGLRHSGVSSWFAKQSSSNGTQHDVYLFADAADGTKFLGHLGYTLDPVNSGIAMISDHSVAPGLQGTAAETELYRAGMQSNPNITGLSGPACETDGMLSLQNTGLTNFVSSMRELGMATRLSGERLVSEPPQVDYHVEAAPR